MGYAGLIRKAGQTIDVTRPVPTGRRDVQGTPVVTVTTLHTALPCLATQHTGREVLTPDGDRAIADWSVMLLPGAPPIAPTDTLILHPGGIRLNVIQTIDAPLGHVKPTMLVAKSGGKP